MDFSMFTRRDLQALCKRNKIPANITNVAMIESLKALEFVEGMEEFSQTCQSETAQSSIESPGKLEVTSPFVPPTGGRSTRRRNVVQKEELETAKPSARAPRTTRKAALETPAMVSQSSRKKVAASACKKMDFQSTECIDEENSGVSATPAPSAATARRRRGAKEESTVTHAYSTRRSTRLATKNVQLSNEVGKENLDFSKKELFANDCQESKTILDEGQGASDEVSGISGGVDADITMEVNAEKEVVAEVVSAEKQDTSTIVMEEAVPAIEDEVSNQSEADGAKIEAEEEKDMSTIDVEEPVPAIENEVSNQCEADGAKIEAEVEKEVVSAEKQDMSTIDMEEPVPAIEDEVSSQSEADGAKIEAEEEKDMSTIDMEEPVPAIEDEVINQSEADSAGLELKDTCDVEIEEVGFGFETEAEVEKEGYDEINAEENDGSLDVKASEIEAEVVEMDPNQAVNYGENVVFESEDKSTNEVSYEAQLSEIKIDVENTEMDEGSDLDETVFNNTEDVLEMNVNMEVMEINDSGEKEIKLDASDSVIMDQTTDDLSLSELSLDISLMNEAEEASKWESVFSYVNEKHDAVVEDEMKDAKVLPALTPASKAASAKKVKINVVSDNKENNTFNANDREENLKQLSVRKLTKMLKEKLNITNESSLNEKGNEEVRVVRQALQALPENRKA